MMREENSYLRNITPSEAIRLQRELAPRVSREWEPFQPRLVAGADISIGRGETTATAAVVVLRYPEMETEEIATARGQVTFPYIPGLLSFRELPLLLQAFESLHARPGLILVDGQGIAHPRRLGLASHLGLIMDIPTIGCAKSLLCGSHEEPGNEAGSYAEITHQGETTGAVLRTRPDVKPMYISTGHKIDIATALRFVMACCRGYRLPEPTRLAHRVSGEARRKATAGVR